MLTFEYQRVRFALVHRPAHCERLVLHKQGMAFDRITAMQNILKKSLRFECNPGLIQRPKYPICNHAMLNRCIHT